MRAHFSFYYDILHNSCYDMCTIYSVKSNNFILCPNKETGNVTSDAFIVTTFKVIPQKRSYWTIFCKLSLNVPYQCLFRKIQ